MLNQSLASKWIQIGPRCSHENVGDGFPDRARELEAVTGTRAYNEHVLVTRMRCNEKMPVRSVGIEARRRTPPISSRVRKIGLQQPRHSIDLLVIYITSHRVRVSGFALVMKSGLDTVAAVWDKVKDPVRSILYHCDRTARGSEQMRVVRRGEPMHYLSLHTERNGIIVEQGWRPGARAQCQPTSIVRAFARHDARSAAGHAPFEHGLFDEHLGAGRTGELEVSGDAAFRIENTRSRLVKRAHLVRYGESRKAPSDVGGGELFVLEPVFACAAECTRDEHTVLLADHQSARLMKESLGGAALEIGPELIGPLNEWHVMRMLVVRLANDSRQAVGGSQGVRRRKAIEARDANAALRQMVQRSTSHRSEADDHDVGSVSHGVGHCTSFPPPSIAKRAGVRLFSRRCFVRRSSFRLELNSEESMGLRDFISKQFVDVIQWTETGEGVLAYRYPMQDMEIQYGAQLTVRESQMALFINEGKAADAFKPGLYTLETRTLPLLTNLRNWDKAFQSPFKSDVYFFSTRLQTNQKWGTPNPIAIRDKDFGMIRLRGFGVYSYHIVNPLLFHQKVSGTRDLYTVADLDGHLRNTIVGRVSDSFAQSKIPFLDMASNLNALSQALGTQLAGLFTDLGLGLDSFVVENLSLPEELQQKLDERIGMNIVGNLRDYTQYQVAQSLPTAAANPGGSAGLGAGLGAGLAMGKTIADALSPNTTTPAAPNTATKFCTSCGTAIPRAAKFCSECGTAQG